MQASRTLNSPYRPASGVTLDSSDESQRDSDQDTDPRNTAPTPLPSPTTINTPTTTTTTTITAPTSPSPHPPKMKKIDTIRHPLLGSTWDKEGFARAMEPIFWGVRCGQLDVLDLVPSKRHEQRALGIDIDMPHPQTGQTLLTLALKTKQTDMVVHLLLRNAAPEQRDANGDSSYDFASDFCSQLLVYFAMRLEPSVRFIGSQEESDFLALINGVDRETGETLLSWSIKARHDKLAALLLKDGAKIRVKNQQGKTALEVAAECGSVAIIRILFKHWPNLPKYPKDMRILRKAMALAVRADRPYIIAECLSFYRDYWRRLQEPDYDSDEDSGDPDWAATKAGELAAHHYFLYGQALTMPTTAELERRTTDDFLLTSKQRVSLGLDEIEVLAIQLNRPRVLEMIAAHCKPKN